MEKKKREEQFDLLRVLCCIMIILLHCGSGYAEEKFISEVPKYYALIGRFYETITRVAVPCFVMMSGRFLLSDERNKKYGYFYKKSFYKLGVPALAFSILYVLYAYAQLVLATMLEIETNKGWSDPLIDFVNGRPHIVMWYMYMLVGLYALVPVIMRAKEGLTRKQYLRVSLGMLAFGIFIQKTCKLSWPVQCISYVGYFMFGNAISLYRIKEKTGKRLISLGIMLLIVIYSWNVLATQRQWLMFSVEPVAWNIVMCAVCVFVGFQGQLRWKISKGVREISKRSFYIYMIHMLILDPVYLFLFQIEKIVPNPLWFIPFIAGIVFAISNMLAKLCLWGEKRLLKRMDTEC